MQRSALSLIIAVCGDAGGANAVAPVIEALRAGGRVTVEALAYRQACALWAKRNLTYQKLANSITRSEVDRLLQKPDITLLLTGTSFDPSLEKDFIASARASGVPAVAVLDFWSHYALRFSDPHGDLVYVPDRIAVMDKRAHDEMVAAGLDPARIVITGNPAFDDLALWRSSFTPAKYRGIRDALGVRPEELLVLFASQRIAYPDPANPLYPGFSKEGVVRRLIKALDQIAEQKRREIVLIIRPHPSEEDESFEEDAGAIRILVSRNGESRDLVLMADLVTGINSVLLVESCYLGCLTVSLQPGLRLPDALPTNRLGLSRAIYREHEMKPVLEEMLLDKETRLATQARLANLQLTNGATRRVVKLVYQMIGLEKV